MRNDQLIHTYQFEHFERFSLACYECFKRTDAVWVFCCDFYTVDHANPHHTNALLKLLSTNLNRSEEVFDIQGGLFKIVYDVWSIMSVALASRLIKLYA